MMQLAFADSKPLSANSSKEVSRKLKSEESAPHARANPCSHNRQFERLEKLEGSPKEKKGKSKEENR